MPVSDGNLLEVKCHEEAYRSPIAAAVHETASNFWDSELLSKSDMRHFDETCLTPVKALFPAQILAIRERGEKKPSVASLKLLTLVDKKG